MKKNKFVPLTVEAEDDRMVHALVEMKRLEEENADLRAEVERLKNKVAAAEYAVAEIWNKNGPHPKSGWMPSAILEGMVSRGEAVVTEVERLRAASEGIAIGGNHLASALIHILGAGTDTFPPYETDIERAREIIGDPIKSDLWICWAVIMRERDALAALEGGGK